jgi:hypothetical protein
MVEKFAPAAEGAAAEGFGGAIAARRPATHNIVVRDAATAAAFGGPPPTARTFTASNWRPMDRNTLKGFLDITLPSGVRINDCTVHQKNEKRWVGLPARPQTNKDGTPRLDPKTGKQAWSASVEIPDPARRARFQRAALDAVDVLLAGEGAP